MHKHKDKKKIENKRSNEQPSKYTTTAKSQDDSDGVINSFSKRTLTTNWSKYEEETNPIDDNEQLCAADFEKLLVTPSPVGSHFVFSTERNWENTEATSQYFKLNILDLASTLASLPFYVRQGYAPENIFNAAELKEMDTNARQNLRKDISTLVKPKHKSIEKQNASADLVVSVADTIPETTADADELNALLECTVQPISSRSNDALDCIENLKITTAHTTAASKDIQQWLDDIFDD